MLDLNPEIGFSFITCQIRDGLQTPQPSNPHIESGYTDSLPPHPYKVSNRFLSHQGRVPLDLGDNMLQKIFNCFQFLPHLKEGVSLEVYR